MSRSQRARNDKARSRREVEKRSARHKADKTLRSMSGRWQRREPSDRLTRSDISSDSSVSSDSGIDLVS
jgi:hypothetical protein